MIRRHRPGTIVRDRRERQGRPKVGAGGPGSFPSESAHRPGRPRPVVGAIARGSGGEHRPRRRLGRQPQRREEPPERMGRGHRAHDPTRAGTAASARGMTEPMGDLAPVLQRPRRSRPGSSPGPAPEVVPADVRTPPDPGLCAVCGRRLTGRRAQRVCSPRCRVAYWRALRAQETPRSPPSGSGSASSSAWWGSSSGASGRRRSPGTASRRLRSLSPAILGFCRRLRLPIWPRR